MTIEPTGSFDSDAEADLAILEQLMKLGADLSQPREVNHYFLFQDQKVASKVAREYGKNWQTEIRKDADGRWSVRLTHLAIVTSDDFAEVRASLKRVAAALDGRYDGWEAAAKP
jgi:regulator of ribonuclease activity B